MDELFQWIRSMVPEPEKDGKRCSTERQLFRQLAAAKRTHLREPKTVSLEFTVFKAIGEKVRLDMYISENGDISIYEGKKGKTQPLDVLQLEHYWDGCVIDGIFPNKAILLGREHPESVKELVKVINSKQATDGRNYNIVLKTWQDENIKF